MQLILMGPQGSGKGTQAQVLGRRLGLAHVSTGDILRQHMRDQTPLGKRAADLVNQGILVPDDIILGMVRERLGEPDAQAGFVLDGFPRTVGQAEGLDRLLAELGREIDRVINLEVPREELFERMVGRRVCARCGATYHVQNQPPAVPGRCDRCGGELLQRPDDQPEPIRRRLEAYDQQTAPLLEHYRRRGLVRDVDGARPVEEVTEAILAALS